MPCTKSLNSFLWLVEAHDRKVYPPIAGKVVNGQFTRLNTVHPAVEKWFKAMETKTEGQITSKELQQAFEVFQGKHFSDAACKFVVRFTSYMEVM